jgi:hypothetical protein
LYLISSVQRVAEGNYSSLSNLLYQSLKIIPLS